MYALQQQQHKIIAVYQLNGLWTCSVSYGSTKGYQIQWVTIKLIELKLVQKCHSTRSHKYDRKKLTQKPRERKPHEGKIK